MPITKLKATSRGRKAVAAAAVFAVVSGWTAFVSTRTTPAHPDATPQIVHAAVDAGLTPPAVRLAIDAIIKGWEGLRLTAYWDPYGKVWTICYGETEGVRKGMTKTAAECVAMLERRVTRDYYLRLVDKVPEFVKAPDSVQAAMTAGAYNYGVGRSIRSKAAGLVGEYRYRAACDALTAFNRAGGQRLQGLVNRREMGDRYRVGEGELCVSGL